MNTTYQQHFDEILPPDREILAELICAWHFQDRYSNFSRDSRENWENCCDFVRVHDDVDNNASSSGSVAMMTSIFSQPFAQTPFYYLSMCSSSILWSPEMAGSKNSMRNSAINNSANKIHALWTAKCLEHDVIQWKNLWKKKYSPLLCRIKNHPRCQYHLSPSLPVSWNASHYIPEDERILMLGCRNH